MSRVCEPQKPNSFSVGLAHARGTHINNYEFLSVRINEATKTDKNNG